MCIAEKKEGGGGTKRRRRWWRRGYSQHSFLESMPLPCPSHRPAGRWGAPWGRRWEGYAWEVHTDISIPPRSLALLSFINKFISWLLGCDLPTGQDSSFTLLGAFISQHNYIAIISWVYWRYLNWVPVIPKEAEEAREEEKEEEMAGRHR